MNPAKMYSLTFTKLWQEFCGKFKERLIKHCLNGYVQLKNFTNENTTTNQIIWQKS